MRKGLSKDNLPNLQSDKCCHNPDCDSFDNCEACWEDYRECHKRSNAEVLADLLKGFNSQEDFVQEQIAEFVACPKKPFECEHYGDIYPGCIECKTRWLKEKWKE